MDGQGIEPCKPRRTAELQSAAAPLRRAIRDGWRGPRESNPPGRVCSPAPCRLARASSSKSKIHRMLVADAAGFEPACRRKPTICFRNSAHKPLGHAPWMAVRQGVEPWRRIAAAIAFPTRALWPLGHLTSDRCVADGARFERARRGTPSLTAFKAGAIDRSANRPGFALASQRTWPDHDAQSSYALFSRLFGGSASPHSSGEGQRGICRRALACGARRDRHVLELVWTPRAMPAMPEQEWQEMALPASRWRPRSPVQRQ